MPYLTKELEGALEDVTAMHFGKLQQEGVVFDSFSMEHLDPYDPIFIDAPRLTQHGAGGIDPRKVLIQDPTNETMAFYHHFLEFDIQF